MRKEFELNEQPQQTQQITGWVRINTDKEVKSQLLQTILA
jgi:hypothetical protein